MFAKIINESNNKLKTVVVSTASPYKFAESVLDAIGKKDIPEDEYEQAKILREISAAPIPGAMEEIHLATIRHNTVCEIDEMGAEVEKFLKII